MTSTGGVFGQSSFSHAVAASNVSFILIEPPPRRLSNDSHAPSIKEWRLPFAQHLQPKDLERIVYPVNSYAIMDGFDDFVPDSPIPQVMFTLSGRYQRSLFTASHRQVHASLSQTSKRFLLQDDGCLPCDAPPRGIEIAYRHVYNTMCFLPVRLETWNEKVEGEKKIQKVLMTGLGTGVGKISPAVCARQTVLVIKHFLYARSEEGQRSWAENEA